jgi:Tol biopolymer transport system component
MATVSSAGTPANGDSAVPSLSRDGRFVAYGSSASNLVPGDANWLPDSFVLDRVTGVVELVSVSTSGLQGNGRSVGPKLSADGRMVAFSSEATNLDPRDTDSVLDVYVHDRLTKTTTLVSERLGTGPSVQGCFEVSISADGRFVAFDSLDSNVLPGVPAYNVYVRDLAAQTTECVSVGPNGQVADNNSVECSISADGRFVAFSSSATNWFPTTTSPSGGVFVRDRLLGITLPATMLPNGRLAPGVSREVSISADGRYVAFHTNCRLLVPNQPFFGDVVRWNRLTGERINVCVPPKGGKPSYPSYDPVLSADGRFVAFETLALNLTVQRSRPPMALWKDMETGATVAANVAADGGPANNWADNVAISGDGRVVAFRSKATNLVPGASGNVYHVYVRACEVASPSAYCKPARPPGGCVAAMTFQGTPSATAGSGFEVMAQGLDAKRVGLLFYGTSGPWGQPLPDGFLCVKTPIVRAQVSTSGGTTGCDGSLSMDFNAWIASGADPTLVAGQSVHAQGWFRNSAGTGQLSDALALLIEP